MNFHLAWKVAKKYHAVIVMPPGFAPERFRCSQDFLASLETRLLVIPRSIFRLPICVRAAYKLASLRAFPTRGASPSSLSHLLKSVLPL